MRAELGYVDESDMDLVLMLDARTGGPLTAYLAERAGVSLGSPLAASRSTLHCGGTRETDVEFPGRGGALLIEDKIDAPFTTGQPESYKVEVDARSSPEKTVRSLLVCPERRRAHYEADAAGSFSVIVTCEELARVAQAAGDRFGDAAAMVLVAAAEPRPTRPVTPLDVVRSEWGDGYRRVFAELVPLGETLRPGPGGLRTATAEWIILGAAGLDAEAVWSFGHWVPGGEIRMELMVESPPANLPPRAVSTAKPVMWWVTIPVSPMTFDRPASDQRGALEEAVRAAVDLRRWALDTGLRPRGRSGHELLT